MSDDEQFQFASDFKSDTRRTCDVAYIYICVYVPKVLVEECKSIFSRTVFLRKNVQFAASEYTFVIPFWASRVHRLISQRKV